MTAGTIEDALVEDLPALADLLVACVRGGASVGFLDDLSYEEALAWWTPRLDDPSLYVQVARQDGTVVGTVTLAVPSYPNARHRAEIVKLMVAPAARGSGLGRRLLEGAEVQAAELGRWLLMLDTETDSPAQYLYATAGWKVLGVLPDHAALPSGPLAPTTFMWKDLRARYLG